MKSIQLKETDKVVGKVVVQWRDNRRDAARITKIEEDDGDLRAYYEILNGPDKGKRYSANHDPNQEVEVYDKGEETVALLE